MNELKNGDQGTTTTKKGRGVENRDLYTMSSRGSELAKRKAEEHFRIMTDDKTSYQERAKQVGVTEEEYRRGDAFADMVNYVIMEAYGRMMDIKDVTGRKNYYAEVLAGLDRLLGVDGLTADDIKELKRVWSETAGEPAQQLEMKPEEKAKLDEKRRQIEERKKQKAGGPVPAMPDNKPSAQ